VEDRAAGQDSSVGPSRARAGVEPSRPIGDQTYAPFRTHQRYAAHVGVIGLKDSSAGWQIAQKWVLHQEDWAEGCADTQVTLNAGITRETGQAATILCLVSTPSSRYLQLTVTQRAISVLWRHQTCIGKLLDFDAK
jgi:hypothetical protein